MFLNRIILGACIADTPKTLGSPNILFNCTYIRESGKQSSIDVVCLDQNTILNRGDNIVINGKLTMNISRFGKFEYKILADHIEVTKEKKTLNILELSLLTEVQLANKENTIRWRCLHVTYSPKKTFPLVIYSHNDKIDLSKLEKDNELIVKGQLDLWFNPITNFPNMGVIVEELNPNVNKYFLADETSSEIINDFLVKILKYKGKRKFSSITEILTRNDEYLNEEQINKLTFIKDLADKIALNKVN